MRILNEDDDKAVEYVTLYVTPEEARELGGYLESLAEDPSQHHLHLDEVVGNYIPRRITVAVCTPDNLYEFDSRSRRLILLGEYERLMTCMEKFLQGRIPLQRLTLEVGDYNAIYPPMSPHNRYKFSRSWNVLEEALRTGQEDERLRGAVGSLRKILYSELRAYEKRL